MRLSTILTLMALLLPAGRAHAQCETWKRVSEYDLFYAAFGGGLALSGDFAIASGRNAHSDRTEFVFRREPSGWVMTQEIPTSHFHWVGQSFDYVAMDGRTAMCSEYDYGDMQGRVRVFEEHDGIWRKTAMLHPSDSLVRAHFGRRISIDGDRAAIAAPLHGTLGYRRGAVFVFERVAGAWVETQRIDPPGAEFEGLFGLGVALEGDLLAIGQPGLHSTVCSAHVFRHGAGGWALETSLHEPQHWGFGKALSLDQGRLAVGAYGDRTHGGPKEGSVSLYERVGGAWQRTDELWVEGADADNGFGAQVVLDGDRLAVSAAGDNTFGERVQVFQETTTGWALQRTLSPHGDVSSDSSMYGFGLALEGDTLWIGSPWDSQPGSNPKTGAAYVFTLADLALPYCGPANPNSTGLEGVLRDRGCSTLAENTLVLEADQLPPFQPTLFLVSRSAGFVPFFGGSQGNLCLGGQRGEYSSQIQDSGSTGSVQLAVDLGALPIPGGGTWAASAGQTWYFQCWYRDVHPLPTSNATDAIAAAIR